MLVFNQINKFTDVEHEALMGIWWSGALLKQCARRFLKKHTSTEAQFNILMSLKYAEKPLSQQELSDRIFVDKSNLTVLIDSLESLGFVTRSRVKEDRRAYHLHLTEQGMEFITNIEKPYRELIHNILAGFSEDEMRQRIGYMVRIQQAMEKLE